MDIAASQHTQQNVSDLIQANISALHSAKGIINSIPADKYNHVAAPYFESCLGKHMRHILDHYLCFIRDIESGTVNYEKRNRYARLETDAQYSLTVIDNICRFFDQMRDAPVEDKHVSVLLCNDMNQPEGAATYSSLRRELQFLHGHSVHHFALIATMLRFHGISTDRGFGVAPSTLAHEKTIKETA